MRRFTSHPQDLEQRLTDEAKHLREEAQLFRRVRCAMR
jgi:hypothetical protein